MEIKFRGLRTDGKGWVYGDLLTHPEIGTTIFIHSEPLYQHGGVYLGTELIPKTAGQFSGLHDKNGKEIYSGDIVKCLNATQPEDKGFICLFKDYRWKFNNVRYPDDDYYGTVNYKYIEQNCEVIGNIFEHPELLK